jgi:hypothetical protein
MNDENKSFLFIFQKDRVLVKKNSFFSIPTFSEGCDFTLPFIRHDFLLMRAFDSDIKEWLRDKEEGTPVRIEGKIRSSAGSGEMYVQVEKIEKITIC